MKKLTLIIMVLALIGFNAFAQQPNGTRQFAGKQQLFTSHNFNFNNGLRTLDCDTFTNWFTCDTPFVYYGFDVNNVQDSGWLSGHNVFLDKAKAELFQAIPGDSLKGLWIWFAVAAAPTNVAKVTITVWDDNGAGGTPGTVLASKQISIKSIQNNINDPNTGGFVTTYFTTPIANPGTFYAGFSMTYTGGVYSPTTYTTLVDAAVEGCGEIDENSGWEQWSDNSWHAFIDVYGAGVKHAVFPIVCAQPASCSITINPTSAIVCKKKAVTLTASGATTYSWAPSTGLNTTTGPVVSAKPNSTTTYTVTGDNGACSQTVTVTVNPIPTMNLTADPCAASHVLLHANANPNTGVKYKWFLNGTKINGATQSTYSAATSGQYKVSVTITATGCAKTSPEIPVTVSCKVAEGLNGTGFDAQAYPNPFVSSISVTLNSASTDLGTITLSDFSGRVLREFTNVDPSNPFEINEDIAPGVYFITVAQGDNSKMIKVVKTN